MGGFPNSSNILERPSTIDELAIKFAPIIYHAVDEPNLPANVDWFLRRTSLWFADLGCNPIIRYKLMNKPTQKDLINQTHPADCGEIEVHSNGTLSKRKIRTFFLDDVDSADKYGADPREWTTYYHSYPNDIGGVTIQYWRFYAYNSGNQAKITIFGWPFSVEGGFHGGDWEGIHVVLDSSKKPTLMRLLGHSDIREVSP